jgi:hypothetical protein
MFEPQIELLAVLVVDGAEEGYARVGHSELPGTDLDAGIAGVPPREQDYVTERYDGVSSSRYRDTLSRREAAQLRRELFETPVPDVAVDTLMLHVGLDLSVRKLVVAFTNNDWS